MEVIGDVRTEKAVYSDVFDSAFKDKPLPVEKRKALFLFINETVGELSGCLEIPAPDMGVVPVEAYKATNEEPPKAAAITYKREGGLYTAIQFHPRFLASWGQDLGDSLIGEVVKADIRSSVAHEMYHHKQAHRFPKLYFDSDRDSDPQSHNDYLKSRFEYAARLFELKYITTYKTENWKEGLAHFIVGLESRLGVFTAQQAKKN